MQINFGAFFKVSEALDFTKTYGPIHYFFPLNYWAVL